VAVWNQQGTLIGSGTWSSSTGATITTSTMTVGTPIFVGFQDAPTGSTTATRQWSQTTQLNVPSTVPAVDAASNGTDSTHLDVHWTRTVAANGPGADYTITNGGLNVGATGCTGTTVATGTAVSLSGDARTTTVTLNAPLGLSTNYCLAVLAGTVGDVFSGNPNNAQGFTFTSAAGPEPTITTFTPTNGVSSGNTQVTITGTDFRAGATVSMSCESGGNPGGNPVTPDAIGATTIVFHTPDNSAAVTHDCDIQVDNSDGTFAISDGSGGSVDLDYTYNPHPTVTAITVNACSAGSHLSPASGPTAGGQQTCVTGTNFVSGATVKIHGTPSTGVTFVDSTHLTVATPGHTAVAAGTADVEVTNPDGQLDSGGKYAYIATPTFQDFKPPANTGTSVTITWSEPVCDSSGAGDDGPGGDATWAVTVNGIARAVTATDLPICTVDPASNHGAVLVEHLTLVAPVITGDSVIVTFSQTDGDVQDLVGTAVPNQTRGPHTV
jgi:hypothetical protein